MIRSLVICACVILGGCSTYAVVRPDLPPMPASVQKTCRHPEINETDARSIIAEYIVALKKCEKRRKNATLFYDDLRSGLK